MKEADKLMKGSVHENNFCIVHDDLVLMTIEGENHMDKIEQLLPTLVAAHEWITG